MWRCPSNLADIKCSGLSIMQIRSITPSADRDAHRAAKRSLRCRSQQMETAGLACAPSRSASTAETMPQKSNPGVLLTTNVPALSCLHGAAEPSPPLSHVTSSMAGTGAPLHGRILHGSQRHIAHRKVAGADHEGVDACMLGADLSSAGFQSEEYPTPLRILYAMVSDQCQKPLAGMRH